MIDQIARITQTNRDEIERLVTMMRQAGQSDGRIYAALTTRGCNA